MMWMHCHKYCCRGEVQAKTGKREQTHGHLKKKMVELQRYTKQTANDTKRWLL